MKNQKLIGLEIVDNQQKMIFKFLSLSFFFIGSLILRNGLLEGMAEKDDNRVKDSARSLQETSQPNSVPPSPKIARSGLTKQQTIGEAPEK